MSAMFSPLEKAVNRTLQSLNHYDVGSEEYARTMDALVKLHKMKEEEKPSSVSKDTMAVIAANLLGILIIISHENVNVITSKAFGLLLKPRL
jgi:hypothetical protein